MVLSSARIYSSIERLPHRFPVALRYYQTLFDGSLGFELVGDFHSFPSFLGLTIPDLSAEEQFTVYDHPRVLIFRRTERFSPQLARDMLTRDVVWSEMYRISAKLTSAAPDALRITDHAWERLDQTSSAYLWKPGIVTRALTAIGVPYAPTLTGTLALLLAIELLGLATLAMVRRWRIPLPDHGIVSSRFLGLLVFAVPMALLALLDRFTVSRTILGLWYGVVVGFGLRLLWAERFAMVALWRRHRSSILAGNAFYFVALLAGLILRGLAPALPATTTGFGSAQWAAMVRAPILPPPDPLFAGGQLETPYAALVPFTTLTRMVGVAPEIAYNVWLAVLVALLASLIWAALGWLRPRWLAGMVAILTLVPGIVAGVATPMGALGQGNIAVLAAAVLAAGALTLVRSFATVMPSPFRARQWWQPVVTFVATLGVLTLLRAQSPWSFWAVAIAAVALLATARPKQPARRAIEAIALLVVPYILAHPLMVVTPTINIGGDIFARTPTSIANFVLQYGLALLVLMGVMTLIGSRLIDRRVVVGVGGALVVVVALGAFLGLPPLLVLAPLALVLVWLLLEAATAQGKVQRVTPTFFVALVGTSLVMYGGHITIQAAPGDGSLLSLVGLILIVFALGSGLSFVQFTGRLLTQASRFSTALLVFGLILTTLTVRDASLPVLDENDQALTTALIEDASNGSVVAVAPQPLVPSVIARSGLSALVADPDATTMVRKLLSPSINTVIDGRRGALNAIYGSDPRMAASQLSAYAVNYVIVGPAERAMYGDTAGAALRTLQSSGATSVVYEDDDWTLFKRVTTSDVLPFVAPTINLDLPSTKDGMLDQPLATLPIVDEYAWNQWATNNDYAAILIWLLMFEVLGLLALPLSSRIFSRARDTGWAWSKLIGLAVWSYAIWLPVSLGWWTYQWWSLVAGAVILAALSWLAAGRPRDMKRWRQTLARPEGMREVLREIGRVEVLYLVAFGVWTFVRMANPDLWHPWLGGEKPFEFGMLNSIVRSPVMPPPDPFFSGGVINYYYYGLFLVSVPIRATGIDPAVAFNLIVPSLFAFVIVGSATIVRTLTGRWGWGLLGATMVGGAWSRRQRGTLRRIAWHRRGGGIAPLRIQWLGKQARRLVLGAKSHYSRHDQRVPVLLLSFR